LSARGRPLATKVTREHARAILALEREELVRLRSLYETARRELLGRLADLPGERFTAAHVLGTLAQVEAGLDALLRRLDEQGTRAARRGLREGLRHTLEEIAAFEPRFDASPNGAIRLRALRKLEAPEGLLLDRFATSTARFRAELRSEIQRRLGIHVLKRSFMREVVDDIAGRLETSAVSATRFRAERIVRTELLHALAVGNQESLEEAGTTLPGLRRQWDATLDSRTSSTCHALNGQVRGIRELFAAGGKEFAHPPAHPNCRSRVLPWRAEWVAVDDAPDGRRVP